MDTNLYQAHRQWSSRPADERFSSLSAMYDFCLNSAINAESENFLLKNSRVEKEGEHDIAIVTPANRRLMFNDWSFRQFCKRINAPADYLATLPADMVIAAANYGLQNNDDTDTQVYFDKETNVARAITSQRYGRILNHEVVKAIMDLPGNWKTPPARPAFEGQKSRIATEADCSENSLVKPGDTIADAGLYANDRNMFAFLIDPDKRIDDGSEGGLSRGFFVRNSEVGDCIWEVVTFLFRTVCGNHIVWSASDVKSIKVKHLGKAKSRYDTIIAKDLKDYAEKSTSEDNAWINQAKSLELGKNLEDVQDLIFAKKRFAGKKQVELAYDLGTKYETTDGNPNTAYGLANAFTRLSQLEKNVDDRLSMDLVASKILALAK